MTIRCPDELQMYPPSPRELAEQRRALAPETEKASQAFGWQVFADGALPAKTKQLIAVSIAHVTQCLYCIQGHTKAVLRHHATHRELMEAVWVAAEMRAGAAYALTAVSLSTMPEAESKAQSLSIRGDLCKAKLVVNASL